VPAAGLVVLRRLILVGIACLGIVVLSSASAAPSRRDAAAATKVIWMTDDGYTTQDLTDTTSGKTWTYTNTTRWHEVWRVGIRLGTGRAPLTILLGSGTTRWAEPGSWIRFTAHSHDPYTSSGQDCTYAKAFTDYSHNLGPAQPYLQGVTAHEAKLTWNTQRGAEFCAAPAGYEPAKGYSRAELFSQTWMNHRLVNLATIPANGDDSTSVQKVVGFAVAPSTGTAVPVDHETFRVATHEP
jgi:hypothetical protein